LNSALLMAHYNVHPHHARMFAIGMMAGNT
jgi:hypothetical protein